MLWKEIKGIILGKRRKKCQCNISVHVTVVKYFPSKLQKAKDPGCKKVSHERT